MVKVEPRKTTVDKGIKRKREVQVYRNGILESIGKGIKNRLKKVEPIDDVPDIPTLIQNDDSDTINV